jgi:hypothetical protein
MSPAQAWFLKPSTTKSLARTEGRMCFKSADVMELASSPPIHASSQNLIDAPDPTEIETDALNAGV